MNTQRELSVTTSRTRLDPDRLVYHLEAVRGTPISVATLEERFDCTIEEVVKTAVQRIVDGAPLIVTLNSHYVLPLNPSWWTTDLNLTYSDSREELCEFNQEIRNTIYWTKRTLRRSEDVFSDIFFRFSNELVICMALQDGIDDAVDRIDKAGRRYGRRFT